MRRLIAILALCLIVGGFANADPIPDNVDYSQLSKSWVIANGADSATWKIIVKNGTSPVPNLYVDFAVNDSSLGYFSPVTAITDASGTAMTTFYSKTKSGTAAIKGIVRYTYGGQLYTKEVNSTINIDHDTPYTFSLLSYPLEATVGSLVNIQVQMRDKWGNPVDGRNIVEPVTFNITSVNDNSFFVYGTSNSSLLVLPNTNKDGLILCPLQLDTNPGDTSVSVIPPKTIQPRSLTIKRIANGIPASMLVRFDPAVTYIPADGNSTIVFMYTLYDEYGNALNNKLINVSSSLGDWGPILVTTQKGQATARYGPKTSPVTATIFAYAQENPAVNHTINVEFYDPTPANLMLTINPITMASRDADNTTFAYVTAYVVDKYGRPSPGQNVTFEITNVQYDGTYTVTEGPSLEKTSEVTNDAGVAEIKFYPGSFTINLSDPYYTDVATGRCTVTARWTPPGGTTQVKHVYPIWKNYPYLSVSTFVSRKEVAVNDTLDVTLYVEGDGYALRPRAIDVILCTNRGGSMLGDMYETTEGGPEEDKMVYLHQVGGTLLSQLNASNFDRAGVVSFGDVVNTYPSKLPGNDNTKNDDASYISAHYPRSAAYSDYSTIDQHLNIDTTLALNAIRDLSPFGTGSSENNQRVPMRLGLYQAIDLLTPDSIYRIPTVPYRSRSVKAVVLLADQAWIEWGDPTAGGLDGYSVDVNNGYYETEKDPLKMPSSGTSQWTAFLRWAKGDHRQNLAYYAKVNDIKIFPIAYYKKKNNIPTSIDNVFTTLATATGGVYYKADSRESLRTIFEDIAGRLRQEAGVNTTAILNFTQVQLNNITVPGSMAFDYIYEPNVSTRVVFVNGGINPERNTSEETWNQTADWYDDYKLNFPIGNMFLGDKWSANFRLRAKMPGTVSFFGNGSEITFSGGETVTIPEAIIYNPPQQGFLNETKYLDITSFDVQDLADSFNLHYCIDYNGDKTVHVNLFYKKIGSILSGWRWFANAKYPPPNNENICGETILRKSQLTDGVYEFHIRAYAEDSNEDTDMRSGYEVHRGNRFFIFLQ